MTLEKDEIFKVIGDVTACSSLSFFQLTFIERESLPTGIETLRASAILLTACTPLTKSPLSSAVFVELIQFAEKVILSKASCFTPTIFNKASDKAILTEASGFSIAILGFSPMENTWPESEL